MLLLHATATWALFGLIWVVQLVSYPLFGAVREADFVAYHAQACRRITWVVGPLMLLELGTGVLLLATPPPASSVLLPWAGLALIALIWGWTAFVAVPLHRRLGAGFRAELHARLVAANWVRTAAWSARALGLAWLLA